jgi:hypothetical protein
MHVSVSRRGINNWGNPGENKKENPVKGEDDYASARGIVTAAAWLTHPNHHDGLNGFAHIS